MICFRYTNWHSLGFPLAAGGDFPRFEGIGGMSEDPGRRWSGRPEVLCFFLAGFGSGRVLRSGSHRVNFTNFMNEHSYCWWVRNPANSPVEVGSLSHYSQGFKNIPGGCLGSLPSTVVYPHLPVLYMFMERPFYICWRVTMWIGKHSE